MTQYVIEKRPARVVLLTECSMADNITVEHPDIRFERPCNLCPHMKRVTLEKVRDVLRDGTNEIHLDADTAERARRPLERMLAL